MQHQTGTSPSLARVREGLVKEERVPTEYQRSDAGAGGGGGVGQQDQDEQQQDRRLVQPHGGPTVGN